MAASAKDMEENPDVSMKIQTYVKMMKESEGTDKNQSEESPSTSKKSGQPTILHRSEKQKKADATAIENMNKVSKSYQRLGGWGSETRYFFVLGRTFRAGHLFRIFT